MTDAEKAERLARVLWWAYWDGQPPYEWDAEPGRATDWRNTATAALTWLDSLEDEPAALQAKVREMAMQNLADLGQAQEAWEAQKAAEAERDALRAEVERLRDVLRDIADGRGECGRCGKLAVGAGSGIVGCERRSCIWVPRDAQEVARAALEARDD